MHGCQKVSCLQEVSHGKCAPLCRTFAAPTVVGALQLVRFGSTLAIGPDLRTDLINPCAALARAHVQLPNSDLNMLGQVLTAGCCNTVLRVQAADKGYAVCAAVSDTHFEEGIYTVQYLLTAG